MNTHVHKRLSDGLWGQGSGLCGAGRGAEGALPETRAAQGWCCAVGRHCGPPPWAGPRKHRSAQGTEISMVVHRNHASGALTWLVTTGTPAAELGPSPPPESTGVAGIA